MAIVFACTACETLHAGLPLIFPDSVVAQSLVDPGVSLLPSPGDLTGDGLPDLLSVPFGGSKITLHASRRRWAWAEAVTVLELDDRYPIRGAAPIDRNSDGTAEAFAYWGGFSIAKAAEIGLVSIEGDRFMLESKVTLNAGVSQGFRPDSIAVGDVTGDGIDDVVVATGNLVIVPGLPGGGLGSPIRLIDALVAGIELIDLDGDGVPEIAAGDLSRNDLHVFRWDGAGFERIASSTIGFVLFSIDGIDIVTSASDLPGVGANALLLGQMASNFGIETAAALVELAADGTPTIIAENSELIGRGSVELVDLLGGPEVDLIQAGGDSIVDIGADLTGTPVAITPFPSGESVVSTIDADLDGDRDLVVAVNRGIVPVEFSAAPSGERLFRATIEATVDGFLLPEDLPAVVAADFDGDGRDEAFVTTVFSPVSALVGIGSGSGTQSLLLEEGVGAWRPLAVDIDGDGAIDVVFPSSSSDGIVVLSGDGAGGFPKRTDIPVDGLEPFDGAAGDSDGDGLIDIVAVDGSGAALLRQMTPLVFKETWRGEPVGGFIGSDMGDLDADGDDDLILGEQDGVVIFRGQPSGGFGAPTTVATGIRTESVQIADLDGDGDLDAVQVGWEVAGVAILRNDGGMLSLHGIVSLGDLPAPTQGFSTLPLQFVRVGDLDADGIPDITVIDNRALVHTLRGTGGLAYERAFTGASLGFRLNQFDLGDADGDGFLDVFGVATRSVTRDSGALFRLNALAPSDRCPADLAEPAGVLDLADIAAFLTGFTDGTIASDLAAPFGVYDLADISVFVGAFGGGCE